MMGKSSEIWRLNVLAGGCTSLIPGALSYFQEHFVGSSMSQSWRGPPEYQLSSKSKKLNDFVAWHTSAPLLSERAAAIFRGAGVDAVEYLDFGEIKGERYVALNVLNICNFVDFEKSDIFFSSGSAQGNPKCIVIRSDVPKVPKIFKMDGVRSYVFISNEFADVLISEKLSGFGLTRLSTDVTRRAMLGEPLNDHPQLG